MIPPTPEPGRMSTRAGLAVWKLPARFRVTRSIAVRRRVHAGSTRELRNSNTPGQVGQELLRRPLQFRLGFTGTDSATLDADRRRALRGREAGEDYVFGVNRNPGYQYVFVNASWQATRHVAPFVRIENALDQQYQEVLGYSALSRNATGGLRITW